MNSYQLLQQYMCTHFPNIGICKPLFYNMPIGIRFEIGNSEKRRGWMRPVLQQKKGQCVFF
ncbi:DUF3885 domain-containing protein [Aneurinibacillus aneurinilyticus]|uniref:DUF3885 domain-containing protein n=1 Tax=Aneurinibacillus aneurinilyticus TaxID=1391 RepID=UPI003C6CAAD6